MISGSRLLRKPRPSPARTRPAAEQLEPRQLLAAQIYDGALNGKIVFTSAGHGWQYNSTLGRYATDRGDNNEIVEDFGNQDQLTFYADYLLRAGATVVPMRPVGHQTREIVLDNDSPGVTFTGSWFNSASTIYYDEDYGSSIDTIPYRFSSINASETAAATYAPNISVAGFYPVYAWTRDGTDRTRQLYRINHSGGSTEIRVDHRMVGKGWIYLGTYHFNTGTAGNVQISNQSTFGGSVVIADAIRFGNGMGDFTDAGAPGPSGHPREDENSYKWLRRALGIGTSSSILGGGNVSAPSLMAEHMNVNSNPFGSSVYIGFHSNAGGGRGAVGLIEADSSQRTPHQADLALYTGRQINQDMQALNGTFEHNWSTRTTHTFTGQFGEIDLGTGAEMDATIIEVAFHDSVEDAALMRDPKVRDQLARSTYEATIEYFQNWGGLAVTTRMPLAPTNVRAIAAANGDVTLTWSAPATRNGGPQPATGYRIYTSRKGYGFSNPVQVTGTSHIFTAAQLDANPYYYFKVAALNAGGESPASVVVGARKNGAGGGDGSNRILIVNGFDRYDRTQNERYPYAFDPQADNLTDRVRTRYNNTFDYVVQFGEAIEAYNPGGAALGFDTVQNEQVANGTINLANYHTVIWISGTESTADETFSSTEQTLVSNFLSGGGRLFVSGAEIGWDLDRPSGPTAADRAFYNNVLRADYVSDDAGTYTAAGVAGSIFGGIASLTFDNGANSNDDNIYDVAFPDTLTPSGGSSLAMTYTGGAGAATQYSGGPDGPRVVNMGFPFETITSANRRRDVMTAVLNFFETPVSATPAAPDLVATSDTGASQTDNTTNRDNSTTSNNLQFLVDGTIPGATVTIYANGVAIGSAVAAASTTSTTVTTNGSFDLADGSHAITARQTEPGKTQSAASPGLNVLIDTEAPTGDVVDVEPDPRTTPVDTILITFSEPVVGMTLEAVRLTRSSDPTGANLITQEQTLTTSDNVTFTLGNLAGITAAPGTYTLSVQGITAPVRDVAGNVVANAVTDSWTTLSADSTPPVVTNVFVGGTGWTANFLSFLASTGAGENPLGFQILASAQTDELPWTNLNKVSIRFSENVNVAADDLVVRGVNTAVYPLAGTNPFTYDATTFTATWTLATSGIPNEKILLDLDADAGTGVTDSVGNQLDGEWTNPVAPSVSGDTYPSGNGTAGGDFRFRLNMLPGDVNRSGGSVVGSDVTLVRNAQNSTPGGEGSLYTIFKDVNGSASILGSDVTLVRNRQGTSLPAGEPSAPLSEQQLQTSTTTSASALLNTTNGSVTMEPLDGSLQLLSFMAAARLR